MTKHSESQIKMGKLLVDGSENGELEKHSNSRGGGRGKLYEEIQIQLKLSVSHCAVLHTALCHSRQRMSLCHWQLSTDLTLELLTPALQP